MDEERPFRNEDERDTLPGNLLFPDRARVPRATERRPLAVRACGLPCFLAVRTSAVTSWSLRIECQPAKPSCLANSPSSLTVCVSVSYTHLRAHETLRYLVWRLVG